MVLMALCLLHRSRIGGEEALLGRGSWSLEGLFYGDTDKLPEKLSQAFFQRNVLIVFGKEIQGLEIKLLGFLLHCTLASIFLTSVK